MEEVFYSQNVKTALKLAHVRGVALLAIAEAGVALGEYSPLEVKISVVRLRTRRKAAGATDGAFADRCRRSNRKTPPTRSPSPSATPRTR